MLVCVMLALCVCVCVCSVGITCASMGDVQLCDVCMFVHTSACVSKRVGCTLALEADMFWAYPRASCVCVCCLGGAQGGGRWPVGGLDT